MSEELMAMIESLVQEHYGTQGLEYLRQRTSPAPTVQVPEGMVHVPAERYEQLLACEDAMVSLVKTGCIPAEVAGRTLLAAAPAAPVATEAVAQGGGVDVEKVMALVEEYGEAKWSQGDNQYRRGCEFSAAYYMEAAGRIRDRIRSLLTAAPAGVGGWIPVGERRPGVGVVVLGFWKNSAGPHSHVTGQNYGITARNEHGLWYDASEDDNEDDEWMRPDYWQPLPAAPAIANHREVE